MKLHRFKDFLNESVNDKYALLDILREWGVFNPLEFMRYLEELGYTIIELEPVGTNENFKYEDTDDWYDILDEEILEEALEFGNIDSLNRLREELGYVIIKKDEVMNEGENFDITMRRLKRKVAPTLIDDINKIGMWMLDVDTNGLRANMKPSQMMSDKEQYDHVVKYAYYLKKVLKGIEKLEKRLENISKKRRLMDDEQDRYDRLINSIRKTGHYRYPWKFEGFLSKYDQEELDNVVSEFNMFIDKYGGKKIFLDKKEN